MEARPRRWEGETTKMESEIFNKHWCAGIGEMNGAGGNLMCGIWLPCDL